MLSILNDLKGQATVINALTILLIAAFFFNRKKKKKTGAVLLIVAFLLFTICSTPYLPEYITKKLEGRYLPLQMPIKGIDTEKIIIHVLGSGYNLDARLPANAQIGLTALGRLAEGIRIQRSLKNGVIICSGYSSLGLETQAEVTKRAAIILGVDPLKLETLNTPSTTQEEAKELAKQYGTKIKLILVTDAMHMSRAVALFVKEGFNPIAAPTNYKINEGPKMEGLRWWPSYSNISLMNYVIHEFLGHLKMLVFG